MVGKQLYSYFCNLGTPHSRFGHYRIIISTWGKCDRVPPMLNAEFFLADLGVRILSLPIGFFIFRALLRKVAT